MGSDPTAFPPGTVLLDDLAASILERQKEGHLVLQPQPSTDYNDPLNWSLCRKCFNYGIVCFYAVMVFTIVDIPTVAWQQQSEQLNISYAQLNDAYAANTAGLAVGCIFFIPFALKFGRRPVYIVSTAVTLAMTIWAAALHTFSELLVSSIISGISVSVSETLVQMTVEDMFFVHQRGLANAVYLAMVFGGGGLAPVIAGFIAELQGWRWMYWCCVIFLGINFVFFIFCYEETKWVPETAVLSGPSASSSTVTSMLDPISSAESTLQHSMPIQVTSKDSPPTQATLRRSSKDLPTTFELGLARTSPEHRVFNPLVLLRQHRKQLGLVTPTPGSLKSFFRHVFQPFVALATIPAVAYTAITYGALLAWFSVLVTNQGTVFVLPPYNFSPVGVGLLGLSSFTGSLIAAVLLGIFSDRIIVSLARRNKGVYEPEYRLYPGLLPALLGPAGLLLYGFSVDAGMHWIVPVVGSTLFGVCNFALSHVSLSYLIDACPGIIGDSLVGVAFVRNGVGAAITFAIIPWIEALGVHRTFLSIAILALGLNLLAVPMILWGKTMRIQCAGRYRTLAEKQYTIRGDTL